MALDYQQICQDHERFYGTRVPEYGKRFFEDMYADRTHFIFEAPSERGGRYPQEGV